MTSPCQGHWRVQQIQGCGRLARPLTGCILTSQRDHNALAGQAIGGLYLVLFAPRIYRAPHASASDEWLLPADSSYGDYHTNARPDTSASTYILSGSPYGYFYKIYNLTRIFPVVTPFT